MPGQFLTHAERDRLSHFPKEISNNELITYFTLSPADLYQIPPKSASHNRLGFALQLCTLRFLGFSPDEITQTPISVVAYIANQLNVDPTQLTHYGKRDHTRTDHLQKIQRYLGFKKASTEDFISLEQWLIERALEHDKPTYLLQITCEKLLKANIVRPGITVLERMVITARQKAQEHTYKNLSFLLTENRKAFLDKIAVYNESKACSPLVWLRKGATSNTPEEILNAIDKLSFLKEAGVHNWNISSLNPNRRRFLAQLGRKISAQHLQRTNIERRYPILIAFLAQTLEDVTDELIDLYDRCIGGCYNRSKQDLTKFRLSKAKTVDEKLRMLEQLSHIIVDQTITDLELRKHIYTHIPESVLRATIDDCSKIIRPKSDKYYDFLINRYGYIRQFAPKFIEALNFCSNTANTSLLEAIHLLQQLNSEGKRKVPDEASLEFIPHSWKSYLYDGSGSVSRRTYEICTLWELRSALKAGNIWVEHSRRYNNPASYLIPKEKWLSSKDEMCRLINLPKEADVWLSQKEKELESTLSQVNKNLPKNSKVRIEKGELIISPIEAEELPSSCRELQKLINKLIPRVELVDLLIEVDSWTRFTDSFEHAAGSQPRNKELLRNIYASILAQSCNFGFSQMSELAGVSYEQLVWCNNWYIRDETLKAANDILVNYQYSLPLSKYWGGGTLSSSDGQRFPVPIKAQNATALPKYFGYGKGLTFYSWTSDQFSQYGSKVIPTTVRDATYVLDAILDNETELEIMEHTTDTAGYTELVFALFGLLGMKFSPRIKDIMDQKIYRMDKTKIYKNLESLIKGTINRERISRNWDDILRIVASIKLGWVTASLIISKLKEYPQKNALASALIECGRIEKSIFIPSYIDLETERRRLGIQLNKGESIHSLRQFLFFANEGKIWRSQLEDQTNQASCLTLLTNAVICWNTRYMQAILDQLKSEGYQIQESDLPHTAPSRFEHINRYGKYNFNVEEELSRKGLRSLNR